MGNKNKKKDLTLKTSFISTSDKYFKPILTTTTLRSVALLDKFSCSTKKLFSKKILNHFNTILYVVIILIFILLNKNK